MSSYDIVRYVWLGWAIGNSACYIWLEFYFSNGIAWRLKSRLKGSLLVHLLASPSDIGKVSTADEYQEFLRYCRYYRYWHSYVLPISTALVVLTLFFL